jgi:hypothetical protein
LERRQTSGAHDQYNLCLKIYVSGKKEVLKQTATEFSWDGAWHPLRNQCARGPNRFLQADCQRLSTNIYW